MERPEHAGHERHYPARIVLPTADLMREFRQRLRGVALSEAGFEEIVRQVLDVFMQWEGDGHTHPTRLAALPDLHRLMLPELEDGFDETREHTIHIRLINATQWFAHAFLERVKHCGLLPAGAPDTPTMVDLDYAFDCFLGGDLVLFHCPF